MYDNVYFIGIGGIGMSALARYYKFKGAAVSGYDRTPSDLTKELGEEGIGVHYDDRPELVPADPGDTLVVYTPAVPEDLGEMKHVRSHGYKVVKRSRILGEITKGQTCLAVSGTHGKTSTSTMVAHILTHSGTGCSAFLGGISKNYGTNLLMSHTPMVVAEADEFDRSFLQLHPETAVITAMDPDHLDIYGTADAYRQAFRDFASQVSGHLVLKHGLPVSSVDTKAKIVTYSLENPASDYHAVDATPDDTGHYHFDIAHPGGMVKGIVLGVPGKVMVENAVAAAAVCLLHGVAPEAIVAALACYGGVKRRLEEHVNSPRITYIDDYAHHPQELSAALDSIRAMFPGRKVTAIFQPHLYTRTRNFAEGFAAALSKADKLILLDIYPAREKPIPGITSEVIFKDVTAPEKVLLRKEELMAYMQDEPVDVLVSFGAGNIDRYVGPLTKLLSGRT